MFFVAIRTTSRYSLITFYGMRSFLSHDSTYPMILPPSKAQSVKTNAITSEAADNAARYALIRDLVGNLPELSWQPEVDSAQFAQESFSAYRQVYALNETHLRVRGLGKVTMAGRDLAVQYFLPELPKATLVLVHGLYDHLGIYQNAIEFGLAQGFAVVGFDLPGHGLSAGDPVSIDSFDEYADDLAGLLQKIQQLPSLFPTPLYGLGQSTGGSILLNHLWRHPDTSSLFDKQVLMAPLILPRGWALGRFTYALAKRRFTYVKRGLSSSSHNKEMLDFINYRDPLQSHVLSIKWLGAMKAFYEVFATFTPQKTPVLVVQGTKDRTLNWRYNMKRLVEKLPAAQIHYIPGADHQLVNESDTYRIAAFDAVQSYFL